MKIATFIVLLLACAQYPGRVRGARILAIEPYGSLSHWQYMQSILDLLVRRHQVTVITPLPVGNRENYTEIDASSVFPIYPEMDTMHMIRSFGSVFSMMPVLPERSHERDICDAFYEFEPVKELLKAVDDMERCDELSERCDATTYYDMMLVEPFYSTCMAYLSHRLNVPVIYAIPSAVLTPMESRFLGGFWANPTYVPNLMFKGGVPKTLWDQVVNTAIFLYSMFVPWLTETRMIYKAPKHYDVPENQHRPSVVFVNTHSVTEPTRSYPINMVQIGGIHLKPPKPLPDDIFEFIENSPHGVIYFSLGTLTTMSTLPKDILQTLSDVFEQLPQRILWKCDKCERLPSNVMAKNWFPQRDILLHPNVKLFISHGGISSMHEAVDAGVPVLGFPLFFDQPRNMGLLKDLGMSLTMDILKLTRESLSETINELLTNEFYTISAKISSRWFRDKLLTPNSSVEFWSEYALRQKTGPRAPSRQVPKIPNKYTQIIK